MGECKQRRVMDDSSLDRMRMFSPSFRCHMVLGFAMLCLVGGVQFAHAQSITTDVPPQGQILIENRTGYPIQMIEYDESEGSYSPYAELLQDETLLQTVGAGVRWFFKVNHEALIGQYTTTDSPDQWVVLDEDTLTNADYRPSSE